MFQKNDNSQPKKQKNFDRWLKDYLKKKGLLEDENIRELEKISKKKNIPFHEVVYDKEVLDIPDLIKLARKVMAYDVIDLDETPANEDNIRAIPKDLIYKYHMIPLEIDRSSRTIVMAMCDPSNLMALDEVRKVTKLTPKPTFVVFAQIKDAIENNESLSDINKLLEEMKSMQVDVEEDNEYDDEDEVLNPTNTNTNEPIVVRMLNSILSEAVASEASDIHVEPMENSIRIRMRIDGILVEKVKGLDKKFISQLNSRIKVISNMDISETRRPQDGRFRVNIDGKIVDFRVSTMNTQYGEKTVLRLSGQTQVSTTLESLGFDQREADIMRKLADKPYGMILVTGPTGSGKSTSLYGMLGYLNTPEHNIVTIEDPIERQIKGVIQTSVNRKADITFATGMKTILRQDPDIIMVGEIRDRETAEMGIQAALTGHLVLSTLHTNDSVGSITRLMDMGIERFKIPSSVLGTLAQRLMRKNCENCIEDYKPTPEEFALMKSIADRFGLEIEEDITLKKGVGCKRCSDTGYRGREGVFEILEMNEEIKNLTLEGASHSTIKDKAIEGGMKTMEYRALEKVLSGLTTAEEIKRVLFV